MEGHDVIKSREGSINKGGIQAIPTYTMGVFQLPIKLCEELNALCAKFGRDKWEMKKRYNGRVGESNSTKGCLRDEISGFEVV